MLHIVTDSSSMLQEKTATLEHFHVAPLHILYSNQSYLDGTEINSDQILEVCRRGIVPTTSQPSIGEKMDCMIPFLLILVRRF